VVGRLDHPDLAAPRKLMSPPLYPTLPGLTYSVLKRPKFFTGVAQSASGREVRVSYAQNPLWEWDLTYNYLPDQQTDTSATPSDLKQIVGFYLAQAGSFQGFLFKDPDDNAVNGQYLGTGDGANAIFPLVRTYGGSDGTGTEPIGFLDTTVGFNVYVDGTPQAPGTNYALGITQPVAQFVQFVGAPTAGAVITVDMGYYYYVRFQDDHYDFEKFMDRLWQLQKVTLMSLRN
jgi:uncharacterized protein (TIGR02217 family)